MLELSNHQVAQLVGMWVYNVHWFEFQLQQHHWAQRMACFFLEKIMFRISHTQKLNESQYAFVNLGSSSAELGLGPKGHNADPRES